MIFVYYFIIGFIVSIINWIFIVHKNTKDNVNVCIGLVLGTFLWPAVVFGFMCRFGHFIAKYNLLDD